MAHCNLVPQDDDVWLRIYKSWCRSSQSRWLIRSTDSVYSQVRGLALKSLIITPINFKVSAKLEAIHHKVSKPNTYLLHIGITHSIENFENSTFDTFLVAMDILACSVMIVEQFFDHRINWRCHLLPTFSD